VLVIEFGKCTKLFPSNKLVSKIVSKEIFVSMRQLDNPIKAVNWGMFASLICLCKTVGLICKYIEGV
jgi:hypothetical protein